MGRPPCCDKANVKRGLWTPEEDAKILAYVANHGTGNWTLVPKKAGLNRCGKSCRLRWTNYLRPDLKHESFSPQEEDLIVELHKAIGSRWSLIAKQLPGRTDNDVKNYWNTKLKKKLKKMGIDPVTHKPFSQIISDYGNISSINPQLQPGATTNHRKFLMNNPSSFPQSPQGGCSSSHNQISPLLTSNLSSAPPSSYQISGMTPLPARFQLTPNTEFVMTGSPYLFDQASSPASSSSSSSSITVITPPSSQSMPNPYHVIPPSSSSSSCWSNLLIGGGEIDPPPVLTEVVAPQVGENELQEQLDFCNSAGGDWDGVKDEPENRGGNFYRGRGGITATETNSSSPMNSFVKSILDHDSEMQQQLDFLALGEFLDY